MAARDGRRRSLSSVFARAGKDEPSRPPSIKIGKHPGLGFLITLEKALRKEAVT